MKLFLSFFICKMGVIIKACTSCSSWENQWGRAGAGGPDTLGLEVGVCCVLSRFHSVQLFVTQWTVVCQAPMSMGFSRQEYWSELPCHPPGDLPDPGIEPASPVSLALAGEFFTTVPPGKRTEYWFHPNGGSRGKRPCKVLCWWKTEPHPPLTASLDFDGRGPCPNT